MSHCSVDRKLNILWKFSYTFSCRSIETILFCRKVCLYTHKISLYINSILFELDSFNSKQNYFIIEIIIAYNFLLKNLCQIGEEDSRAQSHHWRCIAIGRSTNRIQQTDRWSLNQKHFNIYNNEFQKRNRVSSFTPLCFGHLCRLLERYPLRSSSSKESRRPM